MPNDIFELCPTPNKLIEYAKYVQAVMRLNESDENDFYIEKYSGKIMKKKKLAYWYYFNFILNFIPSDIYHYKLLKHSKWGDMEESGSDEEEKEEEKE